MRQAQGPAVGPGRNRAAADLFRQPRQANLAALDLCAPALPVSSPARAAVEAAGGAIAADVEFLNRETKAFLDGVTENGKKLN